MTGIELAWAAAVCVGSSPVSAERSAISMTTALCTSGGLPGVRGARMRHVAWHQRKQGRSVFTGMSPIAPNPIAHQVLANLRPDALVMHDGEVWSPDPWRPPPV